MPNLGCQGTNCGITTGDHSEECLREAAKSQGWEYDDMSNVKSTMTDEEIHRRILDSLLEDVARNLVDEAAAKERGRIIDYIKQSPPYLFAHSLLLDITKDDDALGRFAYPDKEKS